MRISVIGASRGIGYELLQQALDAGHEVTAVARDTRSLPAGRPNLTILQGDFRDLEVAEKAIEGQDAVCVTVGIKSTRKSVSVFSEGTKTIVKAMKKYSVRRLICVTGIGAGDTRGHGGFFYDRIIMPVFLETIYADKDRQEAVIRGSDLDWLIVRPAFLTNGPRTGAYCVLGDLSGVTAGKISRADVADFILREASEMKYKLQTPLLTR